MELAMSYEPLSADHERIATMIVNAAFKVHKSLGPGLLESVYEVCLAHGLRGQGLDVRRQEAVPILYDNLRFEEGFRFDLLVADLILCEIKAVQEVHPVCMAQLLTYLKLMDLRLGFLMNFHVPVIKEGIQRVIR
jgi:GxxExxY protein